MRPLLVHGFLTATFLDSVREDFLRKEVFKPLQIEYFDLVIG